MPLTQQQLRRVDSLLASGGLTPDQTRRLEALRGEAPGETQEMEPSFNPIAPIARGVASDLMAAMQGTSPIPQGRQRLGELINTDGGLGFMSGKEFVHVDPNQHVILPDDEGKMSVFPRTEETNERLLSLGRLLGIGTMAGAPTRLPGGAAGKAAEAFQDFDRLGIPPTAGNVGGRTAKSTQNTLRDTPLVGNIVEGAETAQRTAATRAADDIARSVGTATGAQDAGEALKRGAQTFVRGDPLDPLTDVQALRTPSRSSGFMRKFEALDNQFAKTVPDGARAPLTNTKGYLEKIPKMLEENPALADVFESAFMRKIRESLSGAEDIGFELLRNIRKAVGRKIGDNSGLVSDVSTGELKALYKAVTDDMRAGLKGADKRALDLFERTNKFYSAGQERIKKVLDAVAKRDEGGAFLILEQTAKSKGAKASLKRLTQLKRSIPEDEWAEVSSGFLRELGRGKEEPFSPLKFATEYGKLSDEAKDVIFGGGEVRKNLDSLFKVSESIRDVQSLGNPSGTGRNLLTAAAGAAVGAEFMATGGVLMTGLAGISAASAAKLMTSPLFLKWAAGLKRTGAGEAGRQILPRLAQFRVIAKDPALQQAVDELGREISDAGSGSPTH